MQHALLCLCVYRSLVCVDEDELALGRKSLFEVISAGQRGVVRHDASLLQR